MQIPLLEKDRICSSGSSTTANSTTSRHSAQENPLVASGTIDESLASIFFPPDERIPEGGKRALRVTSQARVMTYDEVHADLERQRKVLEEKKKQEDCAKKRQRTQQQR